MSEENSFREKLAAQEHARWVQWMHYLFQQGIFNEDGSFTIAPVAAKRWNRQMRTQYDELSEAEKDSDRAEADNTLKLLNIYRNK